MSGFLRGTGVALATPFLSNGSIDYEGVTSLVEYCIKGTVDYLVVLGTTAESVTLTKEEKKTLMRHIAKVNNKRLPMVIGIGGNNTAAIIEQMTTSDLTDFDAILSVVPMYNRPTQEGIYQHYSTINTNTPLPILLYNVPSRTGTNMTAETTLKLAQLDNIIGIKEATGDLTQVLHILKGRPEGFLLISGDDSLALPAVSAGGDGVISVIGQGFPEEFSAMIRFGLQGESEKAYKILFDLLPAIEYAFAEGNPAGIKNILKAKGICEDHVRLPLVPVSKKLSEQIKFFLQEQSVIL